MNIQNIISLFIRDLDQLHKEIESYQNEDELWTIKEGIANSAGTLGLHLTGNINHFIGAQLGKTGYIRNREAEFSDRNVTRASLLEKISNTSAMVEKVLSDLTEEQLSAPYPLEVFGQPMSTEFFLLHLYGHLNYHLGQVNYHRRLLT